MASHAFPPIKSTTHPNLQAEIHYDPYPEKPELMCAITYNKSSRYILGNRPVSDEEDAAITEGVRRGMLIGIPVWTYMHSSTHMKAAHTNPFSCPWDSGRSGWAYISNEDARRWLNVKRLTKAKRDYVLRALETDVEMFNAYLNSEIYWFAIRNTDTDEVLDSCGGYYGEALVLADAESALRYAESTTPASSR